jgi:hypothetical protein
MKLRHWLVALGMVALHGSMALAQSPANVPEPEGTMVTWAVSAGLLVIICLPAFLNPKRSHRD